MKKIITFLCVCFCLSIVLACKKPTKPSTCPQPYSTCNPGIDGMVNVHIVPHTHDDVGWLKTVDQYYYGSNTIQQRAGVQYILDTVIEELSNDTSKRFVYVELAYFWRWWKQQNNDTKQIVRTLVSQGQFEFVIGGWCMNDEATTYYTDMIDQETLGLKFLLKEFDECARPKVAWQLDPFGHSREQASLFAQFGFDGLFLGRLDYQDDQYRSQTKTREFVWRPSSSLGNNVNLFTGILPNIYGPPPGFCFDSLCNDDPIMDDPTLEDYNVDQKVDSFLNYIQQKLTVYRTNNIIITMGSDFQYSDAHMQFKNIDKLIYYVNQRRDQTKVNLFYSTPSCYLYSLYQTNLTWPTKEDDFFPYASKPHGFWTGYYTSRTTLKSYVRRTNNYLQAVRQLSSIAKLNTSTTSNALGILDRAMAVLQHHDAVSGTERQHVARDYAKRLAIGTEASRSIVSKAYAKFLQLNEAIDQNYCPLLNISECQPIANQNNFTILLYNPLARVQTSYHRIPLSDTTYIFEDALSGTLIQTDILEIFNDTRKIPERQATTNYEAVFRVDLPPLGFKVINASRTSSEKEERVKKVGKTFKPKNGFELANQHLQLVFDPEGRMVYVYIPYYAGQELGSMLQQQFCYYDSFVGINSIPDLQSSGAYIFRPFFQEPTCFNVTDFSVRMEDNVQEVNQVFTDWLSQTIRLYDDARYIEFEWQVGPIPVEILSGKEVITRFTSQLRSNGTFYTDSNGREVLRRVRNYRPSWNLTQTEPVSGNYFPINSKIFIKDENDDDPSQPLRQLTIITDRSHGGSSINDGEIEVMLHRRILMDDSLGVTEPLDELGFNLHGLIARGKMRLLFNQTAFSAKFHRDMSHKLNMQPLITFPSENNMNVFKSLGNLQPIQQSLPNNVELLTLMRDFDSDDATTNAVVVRFEHFFEVNEDPVLSQPVTIDIAQLFNSTFNIISIDELTLGANMDVSELQNRLQFNFEQQGERQSNYNGCHFEEDKKSKNIDQYPITLEPMQIRTFRIRYLLN